jgi:MraZ protein
MIRFSAISSALIDDKGRVVLPASFKKAMDELADEPLVIEKDPYKPCLNIYPQRHWETKIDDIERRLNKFNKETRELLEQFYERFTTLTMAPNGRINIPDDFMKHALISKDDKEVIFSGIGTSIMFWNEKVYQKSKEARPDFVDLYTKLLGDNPQND